jgi:hypothetical protein
MPPKRKVNPPPQTPAAVERPLPATYQRMLSAMVKRWPSITITPGAKEIEDKTSELSKVRDKCFLTASMAGVLWNCKRGCTLAKFIRVARGQEEMPPPNDFARALMDKGVEMEPVIVSHFTLGIVAEYRRLMEANAAVVTPGPFTSNAENIYTSATPDGLLFFEDPDMQTCYMIPLEVKFFASKVDFPTSLPNDYLAQVLCQMQHCGSALALLVAGVKTEEGEVLFKVWVLECSKSHKDEYWDLLSNVNTIVSSGEKANRFPNISDSLSSMIVMQTTDCCTLWEFILERKHLLLQYHSESQDLLLTGHS